MALLLEIGGADVTSAIKRGSLKIVRTNGGRKGRCDVTLVSTETAHDVAGFGVAVSLEVTDGATTYFSGTTQSVRISDVAESAYEASFTALDAGSAPAVAQAPFSLVDNRTPEEAYLWMMAGSPVAWWRLGEPSGTTAEDETGAHDGTYVNAPTLGVAGAFTTSSDTAVTFNGTDEYVTCGSAILSGETNLTISCWFKGTSTNATQVLYCERAATSTNALLRVYLDANGRPNFQYRDDAGTLNTVTPTSGDWTDDAWHHVVAVKSGTSVQIWVDGALERTGTLTATDTLTGTLLARIAGDVFNAGQFFPGTMDEVALWDVALDLGQVRALYACRDIRKYVSVESETTSDGIDPVYSGTVSTHETGLEPAQYLTIHSIHQDAVLLFQAWLVHEVSLRWLNPTTPLWTASFGDDPIHLAAAFP